MSEKWNGLPDVASMDGQHWLSASKNQFVATWSAGSQQWTTPTGNRIPAEQAKYYGWEYVGRAVPPRLTPDGAPAEDRADDLVREHVAAHKALMEANQNLMDSTVARDDAQRRLEHVTGLWNAYRRRLIDREAKDAGLNPQEIPS